MFVRPSRAEAGILAGIRESGQRIRSGRLGGLTSRRLAHDVGHFPLARAPHIVHVVRNVVGRARKRHRVVSVRQIHHDPTIRWTHTHIGDRPVVIRPGKAMPAPAVVASTTDDHRRITRRPTYDHAAAIIIPTHSHGASTWTAPGDDRPVPPPHRGAFPTIATLGMYAAAIRPTSRRHLASAISLHIYSAAPRNPNSRRFAAAGTLHMCSAGVSRPDGSARGSAAVIVAVAH